MVAAPRSPRRSLTKSQLDAPSALELLSLLQTITEDGRVLDEEVAALRAWLDENAASELPAVAHLREVVSAVLRDGVVTPEERAWVQSAIETVLPREERQLAATRRREAAAETRAAGAEERARAKAEAREQAHRRRPLARFDFMVAGVSYEGRAKAVRANCREDDFVDLVRELGNRHSRNAILVRLQTGEEIGYVPEDEAVRLAPHLDAGAIQYASVKKVLHGSRTPLPIVWGELFAPDSGVERARPVDPIEAQGSRRRSGRWWIVLAVVAAVALAVALLG
jgi:hypothetical protein